MDWIRAHRLQLHAVLASGFIFVGVGNLLWGDRVQAVVMAALAAIQISQAVSVFRENRGR